MLAGIRKPKLVSHIALERLTEIWSLALIPAF